MPIFRQPREEGAFLVAGLQRTLCARQSSDMRSPSASSTSRVQFDRAQCVSIAASLLAIVAIVLACRWLWQSVGVGVIAVLALAVPLSLPALIDTIDDAMSRKLCR